MTKTNEDIEQFVYDALAPLLAREGGMGVISGDLYPEDCRPLDSDKEDAIIAVGEGYPSQVQSGHVRINIYVPDIDCGFGRKVKDKDRCTEISQLDNVIVRMLKDADPQYLWRLFRTTSTIADPAIGQHFVNINLAFKRNNE